MTQSLQITRFRSLLGAIAERSECGDSLHSDE